MSLETANAGKGAEPPVTGAEKRARILDAGRLLRALRYSLAGLRQALATESAFRQEAAAVVVLLPVALLLPVGIVERILLVATLLLVLIVELLNSAVEAVVDRISPDHHVLSGRAKDFGSAAVLLSILLAILTWGAVLHQRFLG